MFPYVIFFSTVFVEALGNCPVCPPLNPALFETRYRQLKVARIAVGSVKQRAVNTWPVIVHRSDLEDCSLRVPTKRNGLFICDDKWRVGGRRAPGGAVEAGSKSEGNWMIASHSDIAMMPCVCPRSV